MARLIAPPVSTSTKEFPFSLAYHYYGNRVLEGLDSVNAPTVFPITGNRYAITVRWTHVAEFDGGRLRTYIEEGTSGTADFVVVVDGSEMKTDAPLTLSDATRFTMTVSVPSDALGEITHIVGIGAGTRVSDGDTAPADNSFLDTTFDTRLPKPQFGVVPHRIDSPTYTIPISWNVPITGFGDGGDSGLGSISAVWSGGEDNMGSFEAKHGPSNNPIASGDVSSSSHIIITFPEDHVGTVTLTIDEADLHSNTGNLGYIDGLASNDTGGVTRADMPNRRGPKAPESVTIYYNTIPDTIQPTYPVVDLFISNPSVTLPGGIDGQQGIIPFYLEDKYGRLSEEAFAPIVNDDFTTFKDGKIHADAIIRTRRYLEGEVTYNNIPGSTTFLQYFRAKKNTGGVGPDNVAVKPAMLTDTDTWEMIQPSYTNRDNFINIRFTWKSASVGFGQVENFRHNDIQIRRYKTNGSIITDADADPLDNEYYDIITLYRIGDDGEIVALNQKEFNSWERLANPPENRGVDRLFEEDLDQIIDNKHEIEFELPPQKEGIFEVRIGSQEGGLPGEDGADLARAAKDRRHPSNYENDSPENTVTSGPIHFNTKSRDGIVPPSDVPTTVQENFFCLERQVSTNEIHDNTLDTSTPEDYHLNDIDLEMLTADPNVKTTRGGGFVTISDKIQKGSNMYFVVQMQRPGKGESGLSDSLKATAALCHIIIPDADNKTQSVTTMRVLKKYVQVDEGPRSLTFHEGDVYFFEGTHYSGTKFARINNRRNSDEFDDVYNKYLPGNIYQIDDSGAVPKLVYKAGGWHSDVTITDELENEYKADGRHLNHQGTASPLVSTHPDHPHEHAELNMITGGGDLSGLIDYITKINTTFAGETTNSGTIVLESQDVSADINNWNWLRFSRFIEHRIPYLQSNKQKPFDIIKELAYLTHSIMGYESVIESKRVKNVFFMRPRDPHIAYVAEDISNGTNSDGTINPITQIKFKNPNRSFENINDVSGVILINNELFRYRSIDNTNKLFLFFDTEGEIIDRAYQSTKRTEHKVDDRITYVHHILDLEQSVYEPPINELNYRDDSTQLYNQVEIKYGLDGEFIFKLEDYESVQMNGERESSFDVPLDRHQLPWIKYLAKQFLERNKDMKYMITLVLKPTFFLKLGETVVIRQRWRDSNREGWHIFVACQVYDISHSFSDNTTTCVFRTI